MKTRKTCKKCLLPDAPHGKNKNTYDGLSYYCKMCMDETRLGKPQNWKEINRKRRADPEYRDRERKRADELDKQRRLTDKNYVERRLQEHYRYLERHPGQVEKIKQRQNERNRVRREARKKQK